MLKLSVSHLNRLKEHFIAVYNAVLQARDIILLRLLRLRLLLILDIILILLQ